MTPRERLLEVAPLLWGERWQAPMAREMKLHRRSVARFVSGHRPVPDWLLVKLEEALEIRAAEIEAQKGAK